jgi:ABC-type proline/glycine betaine transport system ATPase subunit
MQTGGTLAQFAAPDEILANPASDFVARFVGADRGLKRLSLTRVRDLDLQRVATVRDGESADEARRRAADAGFDYLLVVDDAGRTSTANVWACGDVTGYRGAASAAEDGARVGANVVGAG